MIDIDSWLQELDTKDIEAVSNKEYQKELFLQYVLSSTEHLEERQALHEEFKIGASLTGSNGLRKRLAAIDIQYFGRAYLKHYFKRKSPSFHTELDDIWKDGVMKNLNPFIEDKKISSLNGKHRVVAAPRGHAKSTNLTFKDSLHSILYKYKHYIIIISDASEQADGFLEDIKTELEDNAAIIEDFGNLKGDKAWRSSVMLTSTDIKIESLGSGKKIRGRRHKNWRPDLIILDDVENDENVNTPEQRRKLKNWFDKAVSKAGDTYTDIIYIGTVLHYDSLLSNVLKNPKYKARKYQAVISDAVNSKLWEEWEAIYTNLFNESHQEDAEIFYEANKKEMLEGSAVLWEEKFTYYDLMAMKTAEGVASFNSEMQNEPIDPENAVFNSEWFDFYEQGEVNFKDSRFIFVGANDPSLGKNKKSDTSSIFALAVDSITGYIYVVEASVERRKPDEIITDVIEMHKRLKKDYGKTFFRFGVETVQFQHFFKEVMVQKTMEAGEYISIEEINSTQNKQLRIESLQPLIKNKYIKFNREHKTLLKQLEEYPMGRNDDAPDGLKMAVDMAMLVKGISRKIEYESVTSRRSRFVRGTY